MTKRDFFILLFRIFGLYWFVQSLLYFIPTLLGLSIQTNQITTILWISSVSVILLVIMVTFIFFTEKLVHLLKLDKGFDDDRIKIGSITSFDLYRLGALLVGGIFTLKQFSNFLVTLFQVFRNDQTGILSTKQVINGLLTSAITIAIGILLITNNKRIATLLTKKETV